MILSKKARPHLQRSQAPIRDGVAVTLCGAKISNAVLLALPQEVGNPRDYPGLCKLCKEISSDPGVEYEGVVANGECVRQNEVSAA